MVHRRFPYDHMHKDDHMVPIQSQQLRRPHWMGTENLRKNKMVPWSRGECPNNSLGEPDPMPYEEDEGKFVYWFALLYIHVLGVSTT